MIEERKERRVEENQATVCQPESLQEVFELEHLESSNYEFDPQQPPCIPAPDAPGNPAGVEAFEKQFVPLPEIYLSGAGDFMDAYQAGRFDLCFAQVSTHTLSQEPSGLLPLYLSSVALATFDLPHANEMLAMAKESGKFMIGYWWFKYLYHTLVNETGLATEDLGMLVNSELPTENRILRAWGSERKKVALQLISQENQ